MYTQANDRAVKMKKNFSAFQELAEHVLDSLIQSDSKRNTGYDGASTGWTAWVDESSSAQLQNTIDRIQLVVNNGCDGYFPVQHP
jgi:predicted secreted acid phosphatase